MPKTNPFSQKDAVIDPDTLNPTQAAEFLQRGWLYYTRGDFQKAENDFRNTLSTNPDSPDAVYALALTLKAVGKKSEAVSLFKQVLQSTFQWENSDKAVMIRKLVSGHISHIQNGEWNLSKDTNQD